MCQPESTRKVPDSCASSVGWPAVKQAARATASRHGAFADCREKRGPGPMKRTVNPKRKLLRLILGAALVSAGWVYLGNVKSICVDLCGYWQQVAPGASGSDGGCLAVSTAEQMVAQGVGAALVLGGIAVAASAADGPEE